MPNTLELTGPVGYFDGSAQSEGPFVGSSGEKNYVLRYAFVTPSDSKVTEITFSTTFRYYGGSYSIDQKPLRLKISDSESDYINAGSGYEYDASMNGSGSVTVSGLELEPNTTYYIYLFPGSDAYMLYYCYDNEGMDYAAATYEATPLGRGYIGGDSDYVSYGCYIGNGESCDKYVPYIGDGANWNRCS